MIAGKRAFHEARLQPKDVQVAEVHDNFTISEILAIEDLRFIEAIPSLGTGKVDLRAVRQLAAASTQAAVS